MIRRLSALLALLLLATAAAQAAPADTAWLEPGGTFTVTLDSNPSTGYSWATKLPANAPVRLVSSKTVSGPTAPGIVGAPVYQVFTFAANGGTAPATLIFNYFRPWEKNVPPVETYALGVKPTKRTDVATHGAAFYYLHAHRTFSVSLPANPTTGYGWEMTKGGTDLAVVDLLSRSYQRSVPARIGSGGTTTFTFKAIGVGHTTVLLSYERPGTQPAKTQFLGVTVAK